MGVGGASDRGILGDPNENQMWLGGGETLRCQGPVGREEGGGRDWGRVGGWAKGWERSRRFGGLVGLLRNTVTPHLLSLGALGASLVFSPHHPS